MSAAPGRPGRCRARVAGALLACGLLQAPTVAWAAEPSAPVGALHPVADARPDAGHQAPADVARANTLAWSGRHAEALAIYDHALALNPTDREARLGRARVLSWTDRQDEAYAAYAAVLADHPGDHDALRGIGRVQSWRGRHRDAAARMQRFLQDVGPHDREATLVLAESLDWMGRADRARPLLRAQVRADPGDTRAAALLARLERGLQPDVTVDWRDYAQSDDLRIEELQLAARFPFADGRGHAGPRYGLTRYHPPRGPVEQIQVDRPGAEARLRFSDALEWHGQIARDRISTRGAAGDHALWTYDTYLTWWPGDLWRLDISARRWTFDNEDALRRGLHASQRKLSLDHRPDELSRYTVRALQADFSDGNRRRWFQLEAERRILRKPEVHLGLRLTADDFQLPGRQGYYSPDGYRSHEFTWGASGRAADTLHWQLRGSVGRETERAGGARPIRSASLAVGWELRPGLVLEAAYDHSTSRTSTADGFARGVGRITVRQRF